MKDKYAILKGCAGLGNRIVTVAFALEYCRNDSRKLFIDWRDGLYAPKGENAFYPFFQIDDETLVCQLPSHLLSMYPDAHTELLDQGNIYDSWTLADYPRWVSRLHLNRIFDLFPRFMRPARAFCYVGSEHKNFIYSSIYYFTCRYRKGFILLCEYLSRHHSEELITLLSYNPGCREQYVRRISLQPHIRQIAERFITDNFSGCSLGVHIRATDNAVNADIQTFINKLKTYSEKLCKDRNLSLFTIFLATDSALVESLFSENFENVVIYPKHIPDVKNYGGGIHHFGERSGNEQIKKEIYLSSIIDMYLLSRCDILFYQQNSTFSRISRIWKNDYKNSFDWTSF